MLYNKYQEYKPRTHLTLFNSHQSLQLRHDKQIEQVQEQNSPMYHICEANYANE